VQNLVITGVSQSFSEKMHAESERFRKKNVKHPLLKDKYNINIQYYYTDNESLSNKEIGGPSNAYYKLLNQIIPTNIIEQNIYIVGPRLFMLSTHAALLNLFKQFDGKYVNHEFFGPHQFTDLANIKATLDPNFKFVADVEENIVLASPQ